MIVTFFLQKIKTMKNLFYLLFSLTLISFIFSSCEKELLGCMDPVATNYNNLANTDDGSCLYPIPWAELAQGIWNVDPNCAVISIPIIGDISLDDQLPAQVEVQSDDNETLYIDLSGSQVTATINSDGIITVNPETVSIDIGLGPMDIDVVGSGQIYSENSAVLDLTFSGTILSLYPFSTDCNMILTK